MTKYTKIYDENLQIAGIQEVSQSGGGVKIYDFGVIQELTDTLHVGGRQLDDIMGELSKGTPCYARFTAHDGPNFLPIYVNTYRGTTSYEIVGHPAAPRINLQQ